MQIPASGKDWQPSGPTGVNPWLDHLGRVSYIRGHISLYVVGSVLLLAINLLSSTDGVWADTAIGAWGALLIAHGIILVIARLMQELVADDEDEIRPASEVRWNAPATWTLPPRSREASPPVAPVTSPPKEPQTPARTTETPSEGERVSWKAATDAAWLAPRVEPANDDKPDDPNDFTPLKLD